MKSRLTTLLVPIVAGYLLLAVLTVPLVGEVIIQQEEEVEEIQPGLYLVEDTLWYMDQYGQVLEDAACICELDGVTYYVGQDGQVPQGAAGLYQVGEDLYYVDNGGVIPTGSSCVRYAGDGKYYITEDGCVLQGEPGMHTVGDTIYYVDQDGQIPKNAAGLYILDGQTYYVNDLGQIPTGSVGLYAAGEKVYYVSADGTLLQGSEGKHLVDGVSVYVTDEGEVPQNAAGVVMISDNKGYLIDDTGCVVRKEAGTQIIGEELYYFYLSGRVAVDVTIEYLYFGEDGRYTTGNEELDTLVKEALAVCTTEDQTQSERLRSAYLYVRDNFTYRSLEHHSRGSTDWTESCAVYMFTNGKGNCYCFSSAFLYMARQLGYQAYPISGGVGRANSDHGWVMIPWEDGVTYLYDVELEYAYLYRYSPTRVYNLYQMTTKTAPFAYHFPS